MCQVLVVFYRFREVKEFVSDHIASWEQCWKSEPDSSDSKALSLALMVSSL